MQGALIHIDRIAPGVTVQDLGRPNIMGLGLSHGGAADRIALYEATALLGVSRVLPAFECMGVGGTFRFTGPMVIALTGTEMRAKLGERSLTWGACHPVSKGDVLTIAPLQSGGYGYVTPSCPIQTPLIYNSQAAHLTAGIGNMVQVGDCFPLGGPLCDDARNMRLAVSPDRYTGGRLRYLAGPQTSLFGAETLERFHKTDFTVSRTANRQGVKLDFVGEPFGCDLSDGIASDFIVAGDIQMTGAGQPYVLLAECQTIGGYPRIGTVIPSDLAKCAQAPTGSTIRFEPITLKSADAVLMSEQIQISALRKQVTPIIRDPHQISDLLSYQLISGVTAGDDL